MGSLLDSIKNSISPDLIRSVASSAGESPDGIKKGLETAAVTMLGSLAGKAGDSGFLQQIMSLVSSFGTQTLGAAAGAGGAASTAASEAGSSFLNMLFGGNKAAIESKISQASGLGSGIGGTLLSAAAPLVLGTLASKLGGGVSGLASALTSELPSIRSLMPSGLPGVHLPSMASAASAAGAMRDAAAEKAGGGWLWPVLLLGALLIGGAVWYFNRGAADVTKPVETAAVATKDAAKDATAAVADATKTAGAAISDATKAAWAKLGDLFKRTLPGGVELNIPKDGVENHLVDWIESSKPVDKTTWFDFDRLLFSTGSAALDPASMEQITNVASIMKAYPKVKIKIGGYTDNQGAAAANMTLSKERAEAVHAELVKLGVDPSRLAAEGYGATHPVASNETEEGRAKNRRISLRVTEK